MFKERLISGIALVIIAFLVIRAGGPVLCAVLAMLSAIGIMELYRACSVTENGAGLLAVTGTVCGVLWYLVLYFDLSRFEVPYLMGVMLVMLAEYVFTFPRYRAEQVMAAYFGVVYVAVMLSCMYRTRILEGGIIDVWLIFLSSWGADTCAYCVGMLFGRHKMTPKLSPKKSVEGAVGGVAGAAILGAVLAAVFSRTAAAYALICGAGALLSMVGDLAASAIKRNHDIKDYGHLIPGHGGVLDRFDSVIVTAPVIYFLSLVLLK